MSTHDGRHKFGTAQERELSAAICAAWRLSVDAYCARRAHEDRQREGAELKKSVYKDSLAMALGISARAIDSYGESVPPTLAKCILLARITGDDRLLQLFAEPMGAVAVGLPTPEQLETFALSDVNQELFASQKEFTEAQAAALALAGDVSAAQARAIRKEGLESIRQTITLILLAEHRAFGTFQWPLTVLRPKPDHQSWEKTP